MLWTIAIIFGLLWALGLATATTLGGFIHFLLAVAVVLLVVGTFRAGRNAKHHRGSSAPRLKGPYKRKGSFRIAK